jgi:hypothetical protein
MPRKITPTSRPEREYPLQLAFSLGGVVARRRQKNVGRHQRVRRARNSVADLEGPPGVPAARSPHTTNAAKGKPPGREPSCIGISLRTAYAHSGDERRFRSRCGHEEPRSVAARSSFSDGARAVAARKRPPRPLPTEADLQARLDAALMLRDRCLRYADLVARGSAQGIPRGWAAGEGRYASEAARA